MNAQTILFDTLITIISTLLTALSSWLLIKLKNYLSTKTKNQQVQALLSKAVATVSTVVKATYQTYVEAIKGTEAWTLESQKHALHQATKVIQEELSTEAKKLIQSNFGDLNIWIKTQIESTLYDLKK